MLVPSLAGHEFAMVRKFTPKDMHQPGQIQIQLTDGPVPVGDRITVDINTGNSARVYVSIGKPLIMVIEEDQ